MADFKSVAELSLHGGFLREVLDLLLSRVVFDSSQQKVVEWEQPEDLEKLLDLKLRRTGESQKNLLSAIENIIKYSVRTSHPYFMNQLFSSSYFETIWQSYTNIFSLDPYGLAGQWITDALNTSVYTYEVAPVFTLMERVVLREMCSLVGFEDGSSGLFCPGGSLANGTALNIARFALDADIKKSGHSSKSPFVIFASEEAHYSTKKMASLLGIGSGNVIEVPTDEGGRMLSAALEKSLNQQVDLGRVPLAVVATAGTTVRGAFDPLEEIGEICSRKRVWLHVDAAWGGGLIFSLKHGPRKLGGLQGADSVAVNPHKLLSVPQQCSLLLVKKGASLLEECHTAGAKYLFQKDKLYDASYDCGDKYFQCSRRNDVLKFWLMWKAKGAEGFGRHVDHIMDLADHFAQGVQQRDGFRLVSQPEYINVCFWYVPKALRSQEGREYEMNLHKVAPRIKYEMLRKGELMMNYQPLKKLPNFFRFVSQNSGLKLEDVDKILDMIEQTGEQLYN